MIIADIMTLDPCCCLPSDSAQAAAKRMERRGIGILPVIENLQSRKLLGIVTDRDLCLHVVAQGRDPAGVMVEQCMTREVVGCASGEPVARALHAMRSRHVRRLPVVDSSGGLVGIVSLTDMIRYAAFDEPEIVAATAHILDPAGVKVG